MAMVDGRRYGGVVVEVSRLRPNVTDGMRDLGSRGFAGETRRDHHERGEKPENGRGLR